MSGPTNQDRAEWAQEALDVFSRETFYRPIDDLIADHQTSPDDRSDLVCCISDLVTDVMHLAHTLGIDAHAACSAGVSCFEEELSEELAQ